MFGSDTTKIFVVKHFDDEECDDAENNDIEEGLFDVSFLGDSIFAKPIFTVLSCTIQHEEESEQ